MKNTLELLEDFEERNNISTRMTLYSDGSGDLVEFWNDEELKEFKSLKELESFLKVTNYKLEGERCLSPVQIV